MAATMIQKARDEYLEKMRERYARMSGRQARSRLLDEFCEVTGHERYPATIALRGSVGVDLMSFVLTNGHGREGRWQGSRHPDHGLAYADDEKEIDVVLPRSTGNLVAVMPLQAFRDEFQALADRPVEEFFDHDRLFLRMDPRSRSRLVASWNSLMQDAPASESGSMSTRLTEALVEAVCPTSDTTGTNWPSVRRNYRRAVEYCEESRHPVTSPGDPAVRIGLSLRSLELAFRACAGITPGRYLRTMRLNRVRSVLARATPEETSVHAAALDGGFTELGRFSVEYRRLFDELPSETLARDWRSPRRRLPLPG